LVWARIKRAPKLPLPLFLQLFDIDLRLIERQLLVDKKSSKIAAASFFPSPKKKASLIHPNDLGGSSFLLKNSYFRDHPESTSAALKRFFLEVSKFKLEKQARIESVAVPAPKSPKDTSWPQSFLQQLLPQAALTEHSELELSEIVELELESMQTSTTLDTGKSFFFEKFLNPRNYDLSKIGRFRLNKKYHISVSLNQTILTSKDVCHITKDLFGRALKDGPFDDIDHLKNKRVRTSGELLENQLGLGLTLLEKSLYTKLWAASQQKISFSELFEYKHVTNSFKDFFNTSPLAQYMDQTNPLAEITHKRRLSALGPGGVTRETAGMNIRGIHPSHYGRICPIETPEGKNAGLVNSITIYARKNNHGYLETPFFRVIESQVQQQSSPIYLTAEKEETYQVSPPDINVSKFNFLPTLPVPSRKITTFSLVASDQIELINFSPLQMISIATSLIPFLEHDDANRALMGSNMQRQAIALMIPERPIVGTGLEGRVISDSRVVLQSDISGYILYASNEKIIVQTFKTTG
jgi:DNA-directed RNA polymerase subunit beta